MPDSLLESFTVRAQAVSTEVHHTASRKDALAYLSELFKKEEVADAPHRTAVWAGCPFLEGYDREQLTRETPGLRFDVSRETAALAKIGITQIDLAISMTGSLVQNATAVAERLLSTLPAIHVALVPTSGIEPDMAAAFKKLGPKECSYISFITGPSRTADIERVLTIGVHGPRRLIVLFVDELGDQHARRLSSVN